MKSYEEMMEAMSLKDMKDLGGTAAQKKIAQDRQKAREAKNRGFDPKKEVLKDKPGALVKDKPGALVKRKPDLRKSQLGKWSQGVKSNPTSIKKPTPDTKSDKEPEGLDDLLKGIRDEPKTETKPQQKPKKPVGQGLESRLKSKAAERRAAEKHQWAKEDRADKKARQAAKDAKQVEREKAKQELEDKKATRSGRAELAREKNKAAKNAKTAEWDAKRPGSRALSVANKARKAVGKVAKGALGAKTGETGVSRSGDLEGLSGRNKGLIG